MKQLTPEQQEKAIRLLKESLDTLDTAIYELEADFGGLEQDIHDLLIDIENNATL